MVRSLLRQRLGTTTWKKNRWRGLGNDPRSEPVSLQVCTRWRSLKSCARPGERTILREAPQGRPGKMWSESTFVPNEWLQPVSSPGYIVGAAGGYWEKEGRDAIFFPSS